MTHSAIVAGVPSIFSPQAMGCDPMKKTIAKLLASIGSQPEGLEGEVKVTSIETDSRKVQQGSLFVAIPGEHVDGHDFIAQAVERGCVAVIVEHGQRGYRERFSIPVFQVEESRTALAQIAALFYGEPAAQLVLIGITGTNGKTTTTYLLEGIIREAGGNPGVIGTVNYRYNGQEFAAPFTTPEPVILHGLLKEMWQGGVTHVVMEVSSHALVQKRISGLMFDVALFTNLSRDHLDFHGSMDDYFAAKKLIFTEHLKGDGKSVVFCGSMLEYDVEEAWGGRMLKEVGGEVISCGPTASSKVYPEHYSFSLTGTTANIVLPDGEIEIDSCLTGAYNLENILSAVGVGCSLTITSSDIAKGVNSVDKVPGRLEMVKASGNRTIYVDYAHTPDALHNVLHTLRQLAPVRIIVVFGCGGDRDQGKRQMMGEVAGSLAELVVITADNSRSESTEVIMAEIERGVVKAGKKRMALDGEGSEMPANGYTMIPSRRMAIKQAVLGAQSGDVVLLAGKGHENYQITSGEKIFFDDRLEAEKWAGVTGGINS